MTLVDERLRAADGLTLLRDGDALRIAWGEPDWLGPATAFAGHGLAISRLRGSEGRDWLGDYDAWQVEWQAPAWPIATSVRAYRERSLLVFRCEASQAIEGLATGHFDEPAVSWPWLRPAERRPDGLPEGTGAFGHQFTEFALPTFASETLADFFLLPASMGRPAVVWPLWLAAPDGRALLLAPLDQFHEQAISVPRGAEHAARGVHCGWHGDLDRVPAGFATEFCVWAGPGVRALEDAWGGMLQERHGTRRRSRYADAALGRLSYWTDNGAAYWYRSEPGLDLPTTLERTLHGLREQQVPVSAVELDSWFYPHEQSRPLNPPPEMDVPPTGMMAWEPRADLLPDGIEALRQRLGNPPLILHSRHFSSRSPYFERIAAWRDGERAHPVDARAFADRLLGQAARWGAIQFEQDWLVEQFLGVRALRETPGRAREWQRALDAAASEHGLSLLWCMATPADFCQALELDRVAAIRTSGDYRYRLGNAMLWCWFLYGNALARALGLLPFKDVFLSRDTGEGLDGDPHAEVEAALAALSAGPVGLGDRLGRTDSARVLRTCRADGVLVKPDVPIAALERCFRRHAHLHPDPLLADTYSDHPAGRWHYVLALHASRHDGPISFEIARADLHEHDAQTDAVAFDWRSGACERLGAAGSWSLSLAPRDWSLRVLCPVLAGGIAIFGDPSKFACAGDRRVRGIREADGAVEFEVLGSPGERVEIAGWSERPIGTVEAWAPLGAPQPACRRDDRTGVFRIEADPGERGWLRLSIPLR